MASTRFVYPRALEADDDSAALHLLSRYYKPGAYSGARFDTWDSTGTRAEDANRFTADDILAVQFLSVSVPPNAVHALLSSRAEHFSLLLTSLGPDRDLVDEAQSLTDDWVGWDVMNGLRDLEGVGQTTASKLLARKRPRLRPIWDSVVTAVTGTWQEQWEPMRLALRENNGELHGRLIRLRRAAGLSPEVSALRVLDVITWMEGKDAGL